MADVSELSVKISVNLKEFAKKMKRASAILEKTGKKFREVGKKLTIGLTLPLALAGAAAIKLASDAEESASKFGFVFGRAAAETSKALEEFSRQANRNSFELKEMAANIGALIRPMGFTAKETGNLSTEFVKLGIDLASFFNVSERDALTALRAGIVGETEPLRRLGVQLNQAKIEQEAFTLGLIQSKDEMTPLIKTQAIFAIIMRETTQAQGDAIRTSTSFANSLRGLTASIQEAAVNIGNKLLPLATELVQVLTKVVRRFDALSPAIKETTVIIAGILAVLPPLLFFMGGAAKTFLALKTVVLGLTAAAIANLLVFAKLAGVFLLIGFATFIVIKKWEEMKLSFVKAMLVMEQVAIQVSRNIAAALEGLFLITKKVADETFFKLDLALSKNALALKINEDAWTSLLANQSGALDEQQKLIDAFNKGKEAMNQFTKSIRATAGELKRLDKIQKESFLSIKEASLQALVFGESLKTVEAKIKAVQSEMLVIASTFGMTSPEFIRAKDSLNLLNKQFKDLQNTITEADVFTKLQESVRSANVEFRLNSKEVEKVSAELDAHKNAILALTPILGFNSIEVQNLVLNYESLRQKLKDLQEATTTFSLAVKESLDNVANAAFGRLGEAVANTLVAGQDFGEQMKKIFKDMVKSIIAELVKLIIKLLVVKALMAAFGFGGGGGGGIPFVGGGGGAFGLAAAGGIVTGPTPLIAGEAGPEAIIPLDRLNEFGGARQQTIIVELDKRLLAKAVVEEMPSVIRMKTGIRGI